MDKGLACFFKTVCRRDAASERTGTMSHARNYHGTMSHARYDYGMYLQRVLKKQTEPSSVIITLKDY